MLIDLWREGYVAQGNKDTAELLDTFDCESFEEAVEQAIENGNHGIERRDDGTPHIWGMRLFDNETEARKSFG